VLAVSPEERSELELEEPHTELAERYVDSHLGIEKGCMEKSGKRPCIFHSSVPDPDPHVFGPPGSFFHQAEKIVRKTLIPTVLCLLLDLLFLKSDVNVASKSNK
jgi:hypothetical protein